MRTSVPHDVVAGFIEALGLAPDNVRSVQIEPLRVTVTEYRRKGNGEKFLVGDRAATVVTDIFIERKD